MRSRTLWLTAVLMAALAAVGMAVAAPDASDWVQVRVYPVHPVRKAF